MRYPRFVKKGDTIGFPSPSFSPAIEPYKTAFNHSLTKWQELGHNTLLGSNCYLNEGLGICNLPSKCAAELMDMYTGKEADALISCGGGEMMCEILPYMDFDALAKAEPKWFMGYSDNTNFTFLSATLMDTAAIYGPCAASFGMEPIHPSISDAYNLLCGRKLSFSGYEKWEKEGFDSDEDPLAGINDTEPSVIRIFDPARFDNTDLYCKNEASEANPFLIKDEFGRPIGVKDRYPDADSISMKGRLLGGCMDCLVTFLGTSFDKVKEFNNRYKEDGVIWFLEACDLNVFSIRRAMWQMRNAGWFENCKGFIIGRPMHFDEGMMGLDRIYAVMDIIGDLKVPVLMDADIGHLPPMIPLIVGSMAEVTADTNGYNISMSLK